MWARVAVTALQNWQAASLAAHLIICPIQLQSSTSFPRSQTNNTTMAISSSGANSKAQSVLHFAKWLQHALNQPLHDLPTLAVHLDALASCPLQVATPEERSELHKAGVELWNKCRSNDLEDNRNGALLAQGVSSPSAYSISTC